MEKGTVKHFNSAAGKKFGFIHTEQGEDVFFHQNDGRTVTFTDGPKILEDKRLPATAKTGDVILFDRDFGRKGIKASPWAFEFQYLQSRRQAGIRLLPNGQATIDKYPCLPDIVAEAKRRGDDTPFSVEEKWLDANTLLGYGRNGYVTGRRVLHYLVLLTKDKGWQYKLLDYGRFLVMDPSGFMRTWYTPSSDAAQIATLDSNWQAYATLVTVETSRNSALAQSEMDGNRRPEIDNVGPENHKHNVVVHIRR